MAFRIKRELRNKVVEEVSKIYEELKTIAHYHLNKTKEKSL